MRSTKKCKNIGCYILVLFMMAESFIFYEEKYSTKLTTKETTVNVRLSPSFTPPKITIQPKQQEKKKTKPYPNLDIPLDHELKSYIYKQCNKDDDLYCLIMAVIKAESGFDVNAVSCDGHDHGLMQLRDYYYSNMIKKYGVSNPKEPYDNVLVGISMIKEYLEKYTHKNLALMAYNCGEAGARKLWKKCIYSTDYSIKITEYYNNYVKEVTP